MSRFRNCLSIINTRSGWGEGRTVYASALQQYLDRAGIVHHDVCVPDQSIARALSRHGGDADVIVVCGGDGTLSCVANLLSTPQFAALRTRPLVPLPCGLQNSVAASLGVHCAARAVSAFAIGRVEPVPLWAVRVDEGSERFVLSYIAAGAYAEAVRRMHALGDLSDQCAGLPSLRGRYGLAAFLSALSGGIGGADCAADILCDAQCSRRGPPLRLLVAAQMPLQHKGYSLTPGATFRRGELAVTTAAGAASRLRMLHLLRREAAAGEVIAEDGVEEHRGVLGLRIRARGEMMLAIDGDLLRVPAGAVVDVRRAETEVRIAAC